MESLILDELDRQLVHALQIDGRASFSRVAAVLDASDRTIARRYHRLRSSGALRVVGLADSRHTGHVDWLVRIQCAPDTVTPVAAALAQRDDTSWVGLTSGGTEVTCVTRTHRRPRHDGLLLQKLPKSPRISHVTAHCLLRPVAGTNGWPGRTAALDDDQVRQLVPHEPTDGQPVTLTPAEEKLFAELAKDGRTEFPALATATGWSESTTRRRMEELRRSGVLYFDVDIDPVLLGYHEEAVLWLTAAPAELTNIADALASHDEVAYASATTGPANLAGFLVCRDGDALYDYLAERVGALPGVTHVETAPITRHVKRAGALLRTR
ncbi:Lrp/AsnC family transcriptional regulator [Kibdelosporangium lantanae]